MEPTAFGLLVLGLLLAEPVSRALSRAHWPRRDPVGALLLWQAIGLAGGLSLLGAGFTFGLAPFGATPLAAVGGFFRALAAGRVLDVIGATHLVALVLSVLLGARLLSVLIMVTVRTLRARRRHRDLLDVLATPWPSVPGTRVLDHPVPVAYCLPGRSSRLVVSAGVLELLEPDGVRAVLAHERTHLRERHDLVVLPFVAWGATAPFVRGMMCAQLAVAALIEMRADDVAACGARQGELVGALRTVGGSAPAAALSSFTAAVDERIARIAAPPSPLSGPVRLLVRLAALALIALPLVLLLQF